MSKQDDWNDFLENLCSSALKDYKQTGEYLYLQEKQEQLNTRLSEKQNTGQGFLEDCVFEMGLDAERKNEFMYRQGMKDCVRLLKNMGVLA